MSIVKLDDFLYWALVERDTGKVIGDEPLRGHRAEAAKQAVQANFSPNHPHRKPEELPEDYLNRVGWQLIKITPQMARVYYQKRTTS